ncbi:hypothetical protein ACOZ4B_12635 [Haloferax prahovense]|uniref:hypothetical protein n=1 Tax=Haloferax prahovense TaxID=381852 RepID=UPI003C778050
MGMSDTAVGSATGEHEHTSRWPLVTAGGVAGLYAGAGLFLVGSPLVPTAIPLVLVGLGVKQDIFPSQEQVDALARPRPVSTTSTAPNSVERDTAGCTGRSS